MDKKKLLKKHSTYLRHIEDWEFWEAAYDGGGDFIDLVLEQHPRESEKNFKSRVKEAISFNYNTAIIDLYSFYLTEKAVVRELHDLASDKQWKMFQKDCDLYGTNFDIFINDAQKVASIFGSVGILIDKPSGDFQTKAQEIENNVYPYASLYTLPNIYDWTIEKDAVNSRPKLTYLKLRNYDGTFLMWWEDVWEVWEIPIEEETGAEGEPQKIKYGENTLGEIPFLWMINVRSATDPYFGVSDIKDVSKIVASVIRNISCGEEVIKFAGFPMLLEPKYGKGEDENESAVGPRAIKEFDPDNPDAKPEWLESEVAEPIDAIIKWIGIKAAAAYDLAHVSGIHATAQSKEARSGVALRYEFQQLGSILSKKTDNMNEAEFLIIDFWRKWQNIDVEEIDILRPKEFSIDDLSQSLDNMFKSWPMVASDKFKKAIERQTVKKVLPDIMDDERKEIFDEIESSPPPDLPEVVLAKEAAKEKEAAGPTGVHTDTKNNS